MKVVELITLNSRKSLKEKKEIKNFCLFSLGRTWHVPVSRRMTEELTTWDTLVKSGI